MDKIPAIKAILVATDGSDHAMKAVRFAGDLAARYGARMVIQHILMRGAIPDQVLARLGEVQGNADLTVPLATIGGTVDPGPGVVERESLGRLILNEARSLALAEGCGTIDLAFHDGDPAECILAEAEAESVDVIVMGSRGLSDFQGLLLGSISHKVSHEAPCTCITVR